MVQLATHLVRACPCLRLIGLMTIGTVGAGERDFAVLSMRSAGACIAG